MMVRLALVLTLLVAGSDTRAALKTERLINPYSSKAGASYAKLPSVKKGGTLFAVSSANPKVLNPLVNHDWDMMNFLTYVYMPLLMRDPDSEDYIPCLAEKVQITADHKTMVYTLRKGATWDDGTPVTTDDVEFTYQTLMDPKVDAAPKRAFLGPFQIEKVDQQTFKIKVEHPNINTLANFNDSFQIINKKQFEGVKEFNTSKGILSPVGNGPYQFKSFSRDQKVEFERKKDWWGYQIPAFKNLFNFDSMVIRIIPDNALAYEKFIKGEVDILWMNSEQFGARVKGADKNRVAVGSKSGAPLWAEHFVTQYPPSLYYIGWNLEKPMFSSKKTRRALGMLVDYDQVIQKVYYGEAIRSYTPFGTSTPNAGPNAKAKGMKFDPAKALVLLKEDGWADADHDGILDKTIDGKKVNFEFTLRYNSENPLRAKIAQMVKEQFKKAGIQVNVQGMEWNTYYSMIEKHDSDAFIMGWAGGDFYPSPTQVWHSKSINGGSNYSSYRNPEVDRLSEEADAEMNVQKHFKLMQKIGQIIYDDQPYVFLLEVPGFIMGVNGRIKSAKWVYRFDGYPPFRQFYTQ